MWQVLPMTLDQYLSEQDMKPSAFAAELGVAPSTITRIVRGERAPGFQLVMKIMEKTGGKVSAADWYAPAQESAA